MGTHLTLHVDGSRVLSDDRSRQGTGWAVVACYQDQLLEAHGGFSAGRQSPLGGYHEHIAVVQGVLFAHRLGVPFEQVTLTCDDEIFGYAPTVLHPGNCMQYKAERLLQRLRTTVEHCFDASAYDLVIEAFAKMLIHKVKGHRHHVYQERSDYLARHEARRASNMPVTEMLSYDDWLRKGILYYEHHELPALTWYAAFVEPAETSAEPSPVLLAPNR